MVKKKLLFYLFYIFLQFYLTSLQGTEYFAKEPVGAGCFWPLVAGARAAGKKIPGAGAGAGAAWEKNQEPEPLEKKSGAGAAKKFAGSPALVHGINDITNPHSFN